MRTSLPLALLVLVVCASPSQATGIGINHMGPGTGEWGSDGSPSPVPPGVFAGVVSQGHWNNISSANGSLSGLLDSDGSATGASVSWDSSLGTWDTGNLMLPGNEQLMHGYLDADASGATLGVTDIPYVSYDVIVYHESQEGDGRIGHYTIGGTTIWAKDRAGIFGADHSDFLLDGYVSQAEAEAGVGGNAIVFTCLSGDSFTLTAVGVGGTPRAPIQAIQIVGVTTLTWDESGSESWHSSHWVGGPPETPNWLTRALLAATNTHTVTVGAAAAARDLIVDGGEVAVTSGMAVYDTMQFVGCNVRTYCIGQASSMAAVLLAAGTKGKRYVLPNSRVLIHQPMGGARGSATDIGIQAEEILRMRERLNEILAEHTGQTVEKIAQDVDRDRFMSAEQAVEYGLADEIIKSLPKKEE